MTSLYQDSDQGPRHVPKKRRRYEDNRFEVRTPYRFSVTKRPSYLCLEFVYPILHVCTRINSRYSTLYLVPHLSHPMFVPTVRSGCDGTGDVRSCIETLRLLRVLGFNSKRSNNVF